MIMPMFLLRIPGSNNKAYLSFFNYTKIKKLLINTKNLKLKHTTTTIKTISSCPHKHTYFTSTTISNKKIKRFELKLRSDVTFTIDGVSTANSSRSFSESANSFASTDEHNRFKRELHTINVAVGVNLIIFISKMIVCYMSRSSSMFAEAIHSLADVGNQILLRRGVLQALKGPTELYNYGFSREKFVWSLISAVGVFFLGAGVSLLNGFQGLWNPGHMENLSSIFLVLAVSFVLEGYSFLVALRTVRHHAELSGMKFLDYVWKGRDPTPIAVMLEDSGAVMGIIVAGISTLASRWTNNHVWDSVGSMVVGILMALVAIFMIKMNRSFLIGRSISKKETELILKTLKEDPVVKQVYDCKSEEIGPGKYRFKAEIDFSGETVVERHLSSLDREEVYEKLRHASWIKDNRSLNMALKDYGKALVSQVGVEVDRLEKKIRKVVPGVVHVDLEVDKGMKIEKKCNLIDNKMYSDS